VLSSDDDLLDAVELNGRETHGDPLAIAAAQLVALFVHRAQRFAPGGLPRGNQYHAFIEALALRSGFPLDRYRAARGGRSLGEQLQLSGTGPHVLESVTAVLLVLQTHPVDFRALCSPPVARPIASAAWWAPFSEPTSVATVW
jgi:ADP-ribosylglycohydrolase